MMKFIFKNNQVLALSRNKFSINQSPQNIPLELAFEVFKEQQNQYLTNAQFRGMKKQKQKPKKIDFNNRFKDEEYDSIGAVTFKHSNQSKDSSIQNEKSFNQPTLPPSNQPTLKNLPLMRSKTPAMQLPSDQKK